MIMIFRSYLRVEVQPISCSMKEIRPSDWCRGRTLWSHDRLLIGVLHTHRYESNIDYKLRNTHSKSDPTSTYKKLQKYQGM